MGLTPTSPKLQATDVQVQPDPVRRWLPATPAQKLALDNEADLLLFGGAAGALKTSTALVSLIQERDFPRMQSYFFRRSFPAMEDAMRQAHDIFPQTGARSVDRVKGLTRTWEWPSGAIFNFRQLADQGDLDDNWGKAMSAIAFDESTHWEEKYPRTILSRNRSTDPGLKIRAIFTTNPGNRGHKWHMKMFMGSVCPHCEPDKAPEQGKLYWDAKWPSDGRALKDDETGVKLSVAYVLGNIRDHNLLGKDYVARLYMQSPATAKALLAGCWQVFEGQYFDIWDPKIHVVKRQEIENAFWWSHWGSADYGYSGSAAAGGLFCRTEPILPRWPQGRVIMLDEYPSDERGARREPVRTFARNFYDNLLKKQPSQQQPLRIEALYLGPDSWNDRGDLHTLAGQMNEELEPHGLSFEKADNDRAGGAQLMYSMLSSEEFVICDSCPNTIESMESRIKDPKEPVKVQKITADAMDDYFDACFLAGTLVTTDSGERAIEDISIGDRVLTRSGWQSVIDCGLTNPDAPCLLLETAAGRLQGTHGHPIFVEGVGFIPFDEVRYGDIVIECRKKLSLSPCIKSSLTESSLGVTHSRKIGNIASITALGITTEGVELETSIKRFGNITMDRSRLAMTSTTKTTTRSITTQTICKRLQGEPTLNSMLKRSLGKSASTCEKSCHSQERGIPQRRGNCGTVSCRREYGTRERAVSVAPMPSKLGDSGNRRKNSADCATLFIRPGTEHMLRDSARTLANRNGGENMGLMMSKRTVSNVDRYLSGTSTSEFDFVQSPVLRLRDGGRGAVYNLTVAGSPEYFANGILVHNCRYGLYSNHMKARKPTDMRVQERLQKMWNVDPTTAMMQVAQIKEEEEAEEKPTAYGGAARRYLDRGRS